MRQQQRQRSRGRGRKSSNPLSRNYESNGPDVKIRGNAGHIAEKYSTLARDALSSGDTVMAENYFQHAEHYNRIVASNQPARDRNASEANAEAGNGTQPNLDGVPEEVAANAETPGVSNGAEKEAAQSEAKAETADAPQRQRRNGRPRNNRRAAPKNDGAVEREAANDDALSKDAASLPTSLIGEASEATPMRATSEE